MLRQQDGPARLGRFAIVRRLGRGAQGEVYLAEDTRLGRQVAVKTLHLAQRTPEQRAQQVRALLDEARTVSRLSHPGIVTLYDAGEDEGAPYLVFEYVEGETLAARLRQIRRMPPAEAVDVAIQVLRAVGYAHAKGILHRDLKPANVMLAGEIARVMDFGIAQLAGALPAAPEALTGTPAYLAPEYVAQGAYSPAADLFSVGMLLYEALTGAPAVRGENTFEILHRQVHEPFAPPSTHESGIDERLDALVLKAIAKSPAERFASAQAMEDALYLYLNPEPAEPIEGASPDKQATLQFLLRRMRHKSDFPALSSMIGAINRSAASDSERISELSGAILKDFALTNKLLKLVNTAHYGRFSGTISTISRAVVILGFENVRQVAVTLMLFEHLQNKSQAADLRDEMLASYFTALLGRELVSKAGIRDAEEAFICSMFHSLGKLLTAYYFHEEFQEIARLQRAQELDEARASAQVLGLSFEELGAGVGKAWHFPERLVYSMRHVTDEKVKRPATREERLRLVAGLSTDLCGAVREPSAERRRARMAAVAARYEALGVNDKLLGSVVEASVAEMLKDASVLGVTRGASALLASLAEAGRLRAFAAESGTAPAAVPPATAAAGPSEAPSSAGERSALLNAGIQDITNSLVGDFELNDILRMILETMYRGIGFTRVLLCVRDGGSNRLKARFGLGADVDQVIKRGFHVPLAATGDAFHAAISSGADVHIENVNAESIREHIPEWYRNLLPTAQSIALFPVMVNKKAVALFYGDSDHAGRLAFESGELNLLKTLRNQAVLAIRQRS
jgi:eukaryotic-like serine/threonine-protein kinase